MRLEQFQYLVEIARYKSMTQAAKNLFITQPSLSTSIQNLEEELGFQIFKRSRQGVTPTAKGEELIQIAQVMVSQIEQAKHLSHNSANIKGNLNLVALPAACNTLTFDLLVTLKEYYPKVHVQITETLSNLIISALGKGPATIGIGAYTAEDKLITEQEALKYGLLLEDLYTDKFVAFVSSNSPLANQSSISIDQLAHYPIASFHQYFSLFTSINNSTENKLTPSYVFNDRESIKKSVAQDLSIAILPNLMAIDDLYVESNLIVPLPFDNFDVPLTYYIAYPPLDSLTLTEQTAIDIIRNLYADLNIIE